MEKLVELEFHLIGFPKDIFKPLKNLELLHLGFNHIKVIHSDSFGIHNKLTQLGFNKNNLEAIDEKIVENTAVKWLFLTDNPFCHGELPN